MMFQCQMLFGIKATYTFPRLANSTVATVYDQHTAVIAISIWTVADLRHHIRKHRMSAATRRSANKT